MLVKRRLFRKRSSCRYALYVLYSALGLQGFITSVFNLCTQQPMPAAQKKRGKKKNTSGRKIRSASSAERNRYLCTVDLCVQRSFLLARRGLHGFSRHNVVRVCIRYYERRVYIYILPLSIIHNIIFNI